MPESSFKELKSIDDISHPYYGLYVSRKNLGDLINGKILCAKLDYFGNEVVVLRAIDEDDAGSHFYNWKDSKIGEWSYPDPVRYLLKFYKEGGLENLEKARKDLNKMIAYEKKEEK